MLRYFRVDPIQNPHTQVSEAPQPPAPHHPHHPQPPLDARCACVLAACVCVQQHRGGGATITAREGLLRTQRSDQTEARQRFTCTDGGGVGVCACACVFALCVARTLLEPQRCDVMLQLSEFHHPCSSVSPTSRNLCPIFQSPTHRVEKYLNDFVYTFAGTAAFARGARRARPLVLLFLPPMAQHDGGLATSGEPVERIAPPVVLLLLLSLVLLLSLPLLLLLPLSPLLQLLRSS